MKTMLHSLTLFCALAVPALSSAATLTVNTVNNENPGAGETSLLQAIQNLQDGDTIAFNIPGAGPHVIVTPIGGYPLITEHNVTIDGYTQPGSAPNTNPILGGNNAQIKIVLDSTGADSQPNPDPTLPNRPLRRSTRLDFPQLVGNTGYGETENGILALFEADNVTVRGLSFIARHTAGDESDPSIYCIALVKEATNAHVNGCWFGIAPGGTAMADLKPAASAVAAFRWRIDGDVYSARLRFGTDGDGVNDRAEFNVVLGSRIALALELPGAKVSGNYFNVFPNGLTFVDVETVYAQLVANGGGESVEIFENGRVTDNTVFGTDGDGMSDADERNVAAHSVYDHLLEFYTSGLGAVVAGNYFGVGIDGVTASPVPTSAAPDFVSLPGTASIRVGSNGDGVSDNLEANLVVNSPGDVCIKSSSTVPIVCKRNTFKNCKFAGVPFAEGQNGRNYASYYAGVVADINTIVPTLSRIENNILSGSFTPQAGEYVGAEIDVYTIDPVAAENNDYWPAPVLHPTRWLGAFTDNGPGDTDPNANAFAFDLSSFGLADDTYVTIAVTYSKDASSANVDRALTGPLAPPMSRRPVVHVRLDVENALVWWLGNPLAYFVEQNDTLNPNTWNTFLEPSYSAGRNILTFPYTFSPQRSFFRLAPQ